jgi:putative Mg2+ transporter-C (MgtC) family protein
VRSSVGDLAAIGRIALAGLFGFVVGVERQWRGNNAGPRTFATLALGAAAFTVVAVETGDSARLLAGVVTGVGFIGAGMIFHDSARGVVGFATASSSWAIVAVGVMAGFGDLVLAVAVTGMLLVVLEAEYVPVVSRFLGRFGFLSPEQGSDPDTNGTKNE